MLRLQCKYKIFETTYINHGEITPKDSLTRGDVYHLVKTSLYTCPTLANTFRFTSTPHSPEDESGGSQGGKGIGPQWNQQFGPEVFQATFFRGDVSFKEGYLQELVVKKTMHQPFARNTNIYIFSGCSRIFSMQAFLRTHRASWEVNEHFTGKERPKVSQRSIGRPLLQCLAKGKSCLICWSIQSDVLFSHFSRLIKSWEVHRKSFAHCFHRGKK